LRRESQVAKTGLKVLSIIAVCLTVIVAALVLYCRSDSFQEFARSKIISEIEAGTGLKCTMDRCQIDVFHGRIEILKLALAPKTSAPGLVRVKTDKIYARMSISSFWHFRVRLAELEALRPQVELFSAQSESSESSSWDPSRILNSLKISLRLETSKAAIVDGLFKINDRSAPFNLNFHDLDCEIRYSKKLPSYKIHLAYSQSRLFWEQRNIVHDFELAADLSLSRIAIESFKFRHGSTLFRGSGSMENWRSPTLWIHAAGNMDAKDLILASPSIDQIRGALSVAVDVRYDRNGVYSKAKFSGRAGAYRKMPYDHLTGRYEIRKDVMDLEVAGKISHGEFQLHGDIQLKNSNKLPNRLKLQTRNVTLINVGRFLDYPLIDFDNTTDATTMIVWYGGRDLKIDCDAKLYGMQPNSAGSGKSTLLDGTMRFTYFESGAVQISSANLKSPSTTVQTSGGEGSLFQVSLRTSQLAEPMRLLAGFSPPIAEYVQKYPDLLHMKGRYDFQGNVGIKSSTDVQYDGTIQIREGSWRSFKWDYFFSQVHLSSPRLSLQSATLRHGTQTIEGRADIELLDGERISDFEFQGNVRNVALASLKEFGIDAKISGNLSGSGVIRYRRGIWEGDGQIAIQQGIYYGKPFDREPFDRLRVQARIENQQLHLIQSEILREKARLSAEGLVDIKKQKLNLSVRLDGLPLESLPMIREKNATIHGTVEATGTVKGDFGNPSVAGGFELKNLQFQSWNFGSGKGRIELADGQLHAHASIPSDFAKFNVGAELSTDKDFAGKVRISFDDLNVRNFVPKMPSYLQEISTRLNGKVDLEGKFSNLNALKIGGELDGAHVKVQDYELHNSGPVRFSLIERKDVRLENVNVVGEGTSLFLNGLIPLDHNSNLDIGLKGRLNLKFLEGMEKTLHASGGAVLDIKANGKLQDPQIIGRADFQNAKLDHPDFPLHFSAIEGDMVFSRNLVRFENIRGAASSGSIGLSGIIEHHNFALRSINLGIALRNVRFAYPKDFRSIIDSDLVLSGNSDIKILTGDIHVIRSEYVRNFNLIEQLTSRSVSAAGPLTTSSLLLGLRLNIDIHSDGGLLIDNELTRLRGNLRLTLRGTPAYPSLSGRVEASEGTIFFRGSRFEISHASADFLDRNRINPVLEIRAEANVKTYRLILDAIGDLDHLTLNITSDPPMSTVDILSLLTTGKTDGANTAGSATGSNSRHESQMTGISAASVLSENLTGVLGKRVQRIFGLESFRVDPFLAGAENDPTARVTLSERLAKDLVVTFSRNLTTNQEQIVIIEYDVSRDLSVVATRDEDGKFGLDFRFRKRLR
jgi:translocation and assembly module TamB